MFEGLKKDWNESCFQVLLKDPNKYKKDRPDDYDKLVKEIPNAEERIAKAIRDKEERDAAAIEYNKKIHGKGYQVVSGRLLDHFSEDNLDRLYRTFAPELSAAIERAGKMPDYIDKIEYKGLYAELSRQYEILQKRYNTLCQKLGKYEDVPYELEEVEVKEEPKQPEKPKERGGR